MDLKIGSVVFSKAGRDQGRYYVVVELVEGGFVRIADGDLRKLKSAKLKREKHLRANGDVLTKIGEKLEAKTPVFDSEIRSALRVYNEK